MTLLQDANVVSELARGILPVAEVVARRAAALHVPDPAPFRDALIAATAMVHRLTVVARNMRDFERFAHLQVIDPWAAG